MKNKSTKEMILTVLITAFSVAVVVLAALQLLGVWKTAIYVFEPLMGVVLLLQAIFHWKKNRTVAIFNLCAAGFVFACAMVILGMLLFE